jgi:hypothetical protein
MGADKFMDQNWLDATAQATRVTMVAADGSTTTQAGTQRTKSYQHVTTATTTTVTAGKKAYTFKINAASPTTTLDGVVVSVGVLSWSVISNNDTLPAAVLVTVAGDDVEILTLS